MSRSSGAGAEGSAGLASAIAQAARRERAGQEFGALGAVLKPAFATARLEAAEPGRRGDQAARRYAGFTTRVVGALVREARRREPAAFEEVAVCAVGGFGDGLMAPQSDVDLLFLHRFTDDARMQPVIEAVLYPLWDAGLKVGQGVHTPHSAAALARADVTARTAYLSLRRIEGEAGLVRDLELRLERLRLLTKKAFIKAKLAEQEARHERSAQSRYLAEPNVKEGKGGLRDLQTIRWLHLYACGEPIEARAGKTRYLEPEDVAALIRAESFLWSVRVQVHALRGAPTETLSFELQPAVAERLGYAERSAASSVERLMKHYFLTTAEVGRLTRIFCARLEEDQGVAQRRTPQRFPKDLDRDEAEGAPNLIIRFGRLDFKSADEVTPRDCLRLFRAFAKRPDFDFRPTALLVVQRTARRLTGPAGRDPVNAELFMATIETAKNPVKTLRVMSETGILARMLPHFTRISGRVEYGLYRRFALDEQAFQVVGLLTSIRRGDGPVGFPLADEVGMKLERPRALYLACLIYVLRTAEADPEIVALEARKTGRRLGLDEAEAEDAAFVAASADLMLVAATRRKIAGAEAVMAFAAKVQTERRLHLLFLLTVCHLNVVNDTAWDAWSRLQIADLFNSTTAFLRKGAAGLDAWMTERAGEARTQASQRLAGWPAALRSRLLAAAPDEIARSIEPEQLARFAALLRSADEDPDGTGEGQVGAVDAHIRNGYIEAMVYARDRAGLLADLAGAIAAAGVSVRTVHAMTAPTGFALDFFTVQGADGLPLDDPDFARDLHRRLLAVARAAPASPPQFRRRIGDRRALFAAPPSVRFDLEESRDCVIVEAEGRDRPGLLCLLCGVLSEIGVIIRSAHVATYGHRAVDAFYLQDAPGYKITNRRRLQSIERRLLNVLGAEA